MLSSKLLEAALAVLMPGHLNVLLLIGAVLVCPYKCLGALPTAEVPAEQVQKCRCCQHGSAAKLLASPQSSADEQVPAAPSTPVDDGCCDCLCDGAVVEASIKAVLDWTLLPGSVVPADGLVARFFGRHQTAVREHTPIFAFALDCARQMRFFMQSLLL